MIIKEIGRFIFYLDIHIYLKTISDYVVIAEYDILGLRYSKRLALFYLLSW